jgi:hypothetical protein
MPVVRRDVLNGRRIHRRRYSSVRCWAMAELRAEDVMPREDYEYNRTR